MRGVTKMRTSRPPTSQPGARCKLEPPQSQKSNRPRPRRMGFWCFVSFFFSLFFSFFLRIIRLSKNFTQGSLLSPHLAYRPFSCPSPHTTRKVRPGGNPGGSTGQMTKRRSPLIGPRRCQDPCQPPRKPPRAHTKQTTRPKGSPRARAGGPAAWGLAPLPSPLHHTHIHITPLPPRVLVR